MTPGCHANTTSPPLLRAQQPRDSAVEACRVHSVTDPSSWATRKCHSPGLRSPAFKNSRKSTCKHDSREESRATSGPALTMQRYFSLGSYQGRYRSLVTSVFLPPPPPDHHAVFGCCGHSGHSRKGSPE